MEQKTFKGHLLDNNGDVIGAFPSVNVIQQQTEEALRKMNENINQRIIEYCLKINIDTNVLLKQKAEIELLQIKIEKMKCCGNCKYCKYDQNEESNEYCEKHQQIVNIAVQACVYWEFDNWGK
jgi:uncharacterized protein (DUF39 family)